MKISEDISGAKRYNLKKISGFEWKGKNTNEISDCTAWRPGLFDRFSY